MPNPSPRASRSRPNSTGFEMVIESDARRLGPFSGAITRTFSGPKGPSRCGGRHPWTLQDPAAILGASEVGR